MAQFGVDLYLKSKYGSTLVPSFSVAPFTATQLDQNSVHVQWATPTSANGSLWSTLRLVRSTAGIPAQERDGVTLLEFGSADETFTTLTDNGVSAGKTYYYGVFLSLTHPVWSSTRNYGIGDPVSYNGRFYISLVSGNIGRIPTNPANWQVTSDPETWYLAGSCSVLVAKDYGHSTRLYKSVPRPYRSLNGLEYDDYNPDLARFLSIFGFQLDSIQAEYELLGQLNDSRVASLESIDALAQQFGFQHEATASPRLKRLRTRSHADLMRTKGSVLGLRNALNAIVGWDADVSIGANQLLNVDQADFASLSTETWDSDASYTKGDLVHGGAWLYQAVTNSRNQPPSGTAANTSYWTALNASLTSAYNNPATGGVSTWGLTASAGTAKMQVAVGLDSPLDSRHDGCGFALSSSSAASLTLSSAAPITATTFAPGPQSYAKGCYVSSGGRTYRALRATTGNAVPGLSTDWKLVNVSLAPSLDKGQLLANAIPLPRDKPFVLGHFYYEGDIVIMMSNRRYKAMVDGYLEDPDAIAGKYNDGRYGLDQRYGGISDTSHWEYIGDAGDAWTFSIYLRRASSSADTVRASAVIDWYDINGTLLATADASKAETRSHIVASSPVANLGTSWARVWLTARPPVDVNVQDKDTLRWTTTAARAAFAVVRVTVGGVPANSQVYARCAQFEVADAPSAFTPARQAQVQVLPQRINYCANPSFSHDSSGWNVLTSTIATTPTQSNVGSFSLQVSATASSTTRYGTTYTTDPGTVMDSEAVTVSGYVLAPTEQRSVQIVLQFLDVENRIVGTSQGTNAVITPQDGWVRLSARGTAPVETVQVRVSIYRAGAAPAGETFYLANVLIEKTGSLRDYFDGDIYSADFIWEGAPGGSRTHYYEGFRDKQYRMEDIVVQHIPLGVPFVILYAQNPVTWVPPLSDGGAGYNLDGYDQDGYNQ